MTERDYRNEIAWRLRALRHQTKCTVTSDLMREWQRKALELQCYRRADLKVAR